MKRVIFILVIIVVLFACEKNNPPEIVNLKVLTETIIGNSEVTILASAADEDNQLLTYSWTVNGGEFISETTLGSVKWLAPTEVEDKAYNVTVRVSDGEYEITKDVSVTVEGGKFFDLRDDNIYEFVQIGEQIWMAENLAYLPSVSNPDNGDSRYPYYYVYGYEGSSISLAMGTDNYKEYGVLYNCEAAKIAYPDGWHLPSDEEWTVLTDYLINNGFFYTLSP